MGTKLLGLSLNLGYFRAVCFLGDNTSERLGSGLETLPQFL